MPHRPPSVRRVGNPKPGGLYPIVCCETHADEPGYVVCDGVAVLGKAVAEIIPATSMTIGQILCADGKHENADDTLLVCAGCARAKGWIK